MYSLVLMAALSTGGEAPSFFFQRWGCHGCNGGWSSCHGCWGGWGGCHGGWGSCHGCWGGWGGGHRWSCHGGGGCNGCYRSHSACWGGCYGGCYSACHGCHAAPVMVPAGAPGMVPAGTAPKGEPIPPPKQGQFSAPAKLFVELPEKAKFFVDDLPMKAPSASRSFNTPTLLAGQTYYYVLRAEVERDGKTYQETQRILIRAGETVRATFPDLERSLAAAAAATVTADAGDDDGQ